VANRPEGYNTWIGELGIGLSGGQARRVAIARVVLNDAPNLPLDERPEGLGPMTERELWAALAPFIEERTVLLVSHRPSDIGLTDRNRSVPPPFLTPLPNPLPLRERGI
jgi:ABC-type transport system involved in cytochrome bd biosynthesis fused ATPase/permease subunit